MIVAATLHCHVLNVEEMHPPRTLWQIRLPRSAANCVSDNDSEWPHVCVNIEGFELSVYLSHQTVI